MSERRSATGESGLLRLKHLQSKFAIVIRFFLMFLKEVFYAHQGCIYLIKHTVKPFKRAVSVGLS